MPKIHSLALLMLAVFFASLTECRRMHQGVPIDMFKELVEGDVSGFKRRSYLSRDTEGFSDRLGVDNVLGGSQSEDENENASSSSLTSRLASGRHSKDAVGNLDSIADERRYVPSYALKDTSVPKFAKKLSSEASDVLSDSSVIVSKQKPTADPSKLGPTEA